MITFGNNGVNGNNNVTETVQIDINDSDYNQEAQPASPTEGETWFKPSEDKIYVYLE